MRTLLLVITLVSLARGAGADSAGVVVAGEPTKQAPVTAQVRSWLGHNGYTVVATPLDRDGQKTVLDCFVLEDVSCARAAFEKRSRAPNLVFARVELSGDRGLAITAYWLVKGRDVVAEKRFCKQCDDTALQQTIEELLTFLVHAGNNGRLEIHSKPEGVPVALDGVELGVTPIARDVSVGVHKIELRRGKDTVGTKTVTIDGGATASVTVHVTEPTRARSRLVPELLIGGGSAAIIIASVFIYYGHKGGPDAPLVYPYATGEGIAFGLAGVGAVVGGALLWQRDSHTGPTAMVGPSGTTIGWAGSF
jgi:hypothetical protein